MQFFRASTLLLVVLLGISLQVNGGILGGKGALKALKGLKDGLPLLGGAGLLGALKLALLSKAGLALGGLGTALGAAALANQKQEDPKIIYYSGYGQDSYGHDSYGHDSGYGQGWRRRRDTSEVEIDTEQAFEFVKRSDPSRCTERLVCEIAAKATNFPNKLENDEAGILSIISTKSSKSAFKSPAHKQLQLAMRGGYSNADCSVVYASCAFEARQMMDVVRMASRSFFQAPSMSLKQFIEK